MLAYLFQVAFMLVGMLLASEAVEFIQFDVVSRNACDDFLIGGFGLQTGAINPALNADFHGTKPINILRRGYPSFAGKFGNFATKTLIGLSCQTRF